MVRFYREVAELLKNGENVVLVTLFDRTGSAPRTSGAKMAVKSSGEIIGTVGGGRLEGDAIRMAQSLFVSRQSLIQSFDLTGTDVAAMDMICGGKGELLLDFLDAAAENNRQVYETAASVLAGKEKAWLVTRLGKNEAGEPSRDQCVIRPDGTMTGVMHCDPYILEKMIAGPAKIAIHAEVVSDQRFLVEPLRPTATVYIFGAGHLSRRIAPLSETVGFRAVVLDDRAEYANRQRFPDVEQVAVIESFDQLPSLPFDENSYLVIVTRGHLYDRVILEQVLNTPAAYIGMIGSRSKRDKVFGELTRQGCDKERLARVYAPIGTNIGAETPEELAVSIVGELIQVRSQRENAACATASKGNCCQLREPVAGQ
ncbi:MAG TPA: XdhC family protein [Patescibacteria group bacterium]|nr:XdhC family protein [Patescibacteria group bacterium]